MTAPRNIYPSALQIGDVVRITWMHNGDEYTCTTRLSRRSIYGRDTSYYNRENVETLQVDGADRAYKVMGLIPYPVKRLMLLSRTRHHTQLEGMEQ